MLNRLIQFSLARRALIMGMAVALLALGIHTAWKMPVDVLPDLTRPTVTLLTEASGFAPEEVESRVTAPIENALAGLDGVTRIRSKNDIALSLITIEFDWSTDIYRARQVVQERLSGMGEVLPAGVTPYMTPVTSLMGDILVFGLRDPEEKIPPRKLREHVEQVVIRRLQSIPGIAEVLAIGGGVTQAIVEPIPEKMQTYGITLAELQEAAANAASNTTGGFLTNRAKEVMVRQLAMTTDLSAIGETVVRMDKDSPVRLSDVANVVWGVEPMRGDSALGLASDTDGPDGLKGGEGVVVNVRKGEGFDTKRLTTEVEVALEELSRGLPGNAKFTTLYRQADFIDLSIGNLVEALRDGAIMVAIVLFLFLLNVRVTLITLTAIPLSLAITALIFHQLGLSVNSMTLGGLAVAVGMVVDDAIVDVENVFRRLRENAALAEPLPRLKVIAAASAEVRSSIFYATLLVVLVFLPLLALSGVEGRLFTPIALATIVSMGASFLVSLTVIPVLCSLLLRPKSQPHRDNLFLRSIKTVFRRTWLNFSLSMPLLLLLLTAGLMIWAWVSVASMGGNFLPPFREPSSLMALTTAPGTSLKTTTDLARSAQDLILSVPGVQSVGYVAGRAEKGDHVVPVSTAEFMISFDPGNSRERKEILEEIRAKMKALPGTFAAMSTPLADRIGHMLSGVSAKVAVKIFGPDLEELRRLGEQIESIAKSIPGLEEARLEQQAPIPQLRIDPDRKRALAYGVTPGSLNHEVAALMGGEKVGELYQGLISYDLVIRLPEHWRDSEEKLRNLRVDSLNGQTVPLSYVADIRQAAGPNNILREMNRRRIVVSVNPTTPDLNAVVEELQRRVAEEVRFPKGYDMSLEGEYLAQQEAARTILIASALILVVIIFLLHSYFQSFRLVLLVLTNIPVSLIGSALYMHEKLDAISIATLVGAIAITGIAARNQIMMISHWLHLMKHENESFHRTMVERGALERLAPVLMTALAAAIALVPLILAPDEPGKEILHPVAIVIVGGLVSSTFLGLGLTPSLFLYFCRGAAAKALRLNAPAAS